MIPFFSIIVPIYNIENYLSTCIDSLLNQTFSDYEVILVDDGSTDHSPEICDHAAGGDARFQVIHKKNGGLVSARKSGIGRACGRYILNLDGDDYLSPSMLRELYSIISRYTPDMVAFDCIQKYSDGREQTARSKADEGFYTGEALARLQSRLLCDRSIPAFNLGSLFPSICLKAVRREILLPCQMSVPDQITNGEDTAVSMPALCRCRSLYVSRINGYFYVQHSSSMIQTFRPDEPGKYRILSAYLQHRIPNIPADNQTAYFFNLVVNNLSQAARALPGYPEFRAYFHHTVLSEMGDLIHSCKPWSMDKKSAVRFFLIQHHLIFFL